MTRLFPFTLLLVACGAAAPPNPNATITLPRGEATLTIRVEKVKAGKGPVFCDLFNDGAGFPGASPIVGGSLEVSADTAPMQCVFSHLPAGTYAMSVIQDENDNGKLDTSVFGAPVEGYGASNNVLPATSAPSWDDSKFDVAEGQPLELTVRLSNTGT